MFRKILFLAAVLLCLSTAACGGRNSIPNFVENTGGYTGLYDEVDKKVDKKLLVEKKRPGLKHPEYLRVWRGSYNDSNGNFIEDGWEWILLERGGPDANF